jgi:hypothetical protein
MLCSFTKGTFQQFGAQSAGRRVSAKWKASIDVTERVLADLFMHKFTDLVFILTRIYQLVNVTDWNDQT